LEFIFESSLFGRLLIKHKGGKKSKRKTEEQKSALTNFLLFSLFCCLFVGQSLAVFSDDEKQENSSIT